MSGPVDREADAPRVDTRRRVRPVDDRESEVEPPERVREEATGFGASLRKAREKAGLSQAKLAALAHVGADTISRLESGQSGQKVRPSTLSKLAEALQMSPAALLAAEVAPSGRTIVVDEAVYDSLYRLGHFGDSPNDIIKRLLEAEDDPLLQILRRLRGFGLLDGRNDEELKANFDQLLQAEALTNRENRKLQFARHLGLLPHPKEPGTAARLFRAAKRALESDAPRKHLLAMRAMFLPSKLEGEELQAAFEQMVASEIEQGKPHELLVLTRASGILPPLPK